MIVLGSSSAGMWKGDYYVAPFSQFAKLPVEPGTKLKVVRTKDIFVPDGEVLFPLADSRDKAEFKVGGYTEEVTKEELEELIEMSVDEVEKKEGQKKEEPPQVSTEAAANVDAERLLAGESTQQAAASTTSPAAGPGGDGITSVKPMTDLLETTAFDLDTRRIETAETKRIVRAELVKKIEEYRSPRNPEAVEHRRADPLLWLLASP